MLQTNTPPSAARLTRCLPETGRLVRLMVGLLALGLLLATDLSGQALSGRLTSAEDGAPVAGATVMLLDANAQPIGETAAAADGTYSIEVPGPGSYMVLIHVDGFADQLSAPIEVPEGGASYSPSVRLTALAGAASTAAGPDQMDDAQFLAQYMAETCAGRFVSGLHGILLGAVRNEGSGEPLSFIQVTVRWSDAFGQQFRETRSDESGFYYICDVPAGRQVAVRAQANEANAEGRIERITMTAGNMRSMDVTIPLSNPNQKGQLIGTVRDVDSSRPIIGATVRLREDGRTTTTNSRGLFIMREVDPGLEVMEVEVLGYDLVQEPIQVFGGRGQQLEVFVSREPIPIAPIMVTVRPRSWFSDRVGLEDRIAKGFGYFVLREDIELRQPNNLGDIMYGVPGVTVRRSGGGVSARYTVQLRGAANMQNEICAPMVWLDGVKYGADFDAFSSVVAFDIEAVEIYRGASEVPGEFSGGDARCGVVVVWTRRGSGMGGGE